MASDEGSEPELEAVAQPCEAERPVVPAGRVPDLELGFARDSEPRSLVLLGEEGPPQLRRFARLAQC